DPDRMLIRARRMGLPPLRGEVRMPVDVVAVTARYVEDLPRRFDRRVMRVGEVPPVDVDVLVGLLMGMIPAADVGRVDDDIGHRDRRTTRGARWRGIPPRGISPHNTRL